MLRSLKSAIFRKNSTMRLLYFWTEDNIQVTVLFLINILVIQIASGYAFTLSDFFKDVYECFTSLFITHSCILFLLWRHIVFRKEYFQFWATLISIKCIALYLWNSYSDINLWVLIFNLTGKYFGRQNIPFKKKTLIIIMTIFYAYHTLFMQCFILMFYRFVVYFESPDDVLSVSFLLQMSDC